MKYCIEEDDLVWEEICVSVIDLEIPFEVEVDMCSPSADKMVFLEEVIDDGSDKNLLNVYMHIYLRVGISS